MPYGTLASIKLIHVKKPPEKPPAPAKSKFYGDFDDKDEVFISTSEDEEEDPSAGPGKPPTNHIIWRQKKTKNTKKQKAQTNKEEKIEEKENTQKQKTKKNKKTIINYMIII